MLGIPRKLRVGLDPTSPGSKRSKHRVGPHTPSRGVMSRAWEALPLTHLAGYRIPNWPTQRINGEVLFARMIKSARLELVRAIGQDSLAF